MFFPEGQIRVHLYGQPVDMRNYAESIVMRSWRRCPRARSGNGAIVTAHNVTGGRRTMTSAEPVVCQERGIGLA